VNDFIFVPLYVDDKTALREAEVEEVELGNRRNFTLKTIGHKNSYYQISRFENRKQPFFVVLDSENKVIRTADHETNTEKKFLGFLNAALKEFKGN